MFDHRVDPPRCRCMFPAAATRWRASAIANTTDIVPPGPSRTLPTVRYWYHRLYRSIRIIGPLCDSPLIPRDLWIPVSTRTRYAWSRLAGFSNELCTRVYRNYGDLRRLSCTTTAPTIHRTSPLNYFAIRGPRRSLYSRTTSVIFVTRSQCTDHCLRTTPMLTTASSLLMS